MRDQFLLQQRVWVLIGFVEDEGTKNLNWYNLKDEFRGAL